MYKSFVLKESLESGLMWRKLEIQFYTIKFDANFFNFIESFPLYPSKRWDIVRKYQKTKGTGSKRGDIGLVIILVPKYFLIRWLKSLIKFWLVGS